VVSRAEFVELVDEVGVVASERAERHSEVSVLLLEVHERPVEGRHNVVEACTKACCLQFALFVFLIDFQFSSFKAQLFFNILR